MLVSKSLLEDFEQRARTYFPSVNLRVHSIDGVMFTLRNENTGADLSPWISRNEMYIVLKVLCNVTRDELLARIASFREKKDLEALFREQEEEKKRWERYGGFKNKNDVDLQ